MSAVIFREAWRKSDQELERAAIDYWRESGRRLPARVDPEERARELCAVAFRDAKPVGVATATLAVVEQFRCRMAVYRCAVTHGLRHAPLSWRITEYSQTVLEQWSLAHPEEAVMGVMAVIQSRELIIRYPQVFGVANMVFTGFNPAGFPIRVAWFKHATIPTEWPPRPLNAPSPARQESKPKATWGGEIRVEHTFKS